MALIITHISDKFSTSPQITVDDVAEIAALGFKTIINNRPDGEGGVEQPLSEAIKVAAESAGIKYVHIPVIPGNITEANVAECATFLLNTPTPILGFCRTGNRASNLYQQASNKNSHGSTSSAKQNWLMQKICNFFKNKCLVTKLVRKLSSK
jgi:uncharacterized protein (TIGR01244 family)